MNARQKLRQAHLQEWAVRFSEQKASGLTIRQWCEENDFSIHAYNYWKRLLKEEAVNQVLPDIVPVSVPVISSLDTSTEIVSPIIRANRTNCAIQSNVSDVTMQINGVSISIDPSVSEAFLNKLIKAVCHA